ncbi:MAG: S8 family serine peptidase, partial [Planctomycetota bacterium]
MRPIPIRTDASFYLSGAGRPAPGGGDAGLRRSAVLADRLIVRLRGGTGERALDDLNLAYGATVLRKSRHRPSYVLRLPKHAIATIDDALAFYRAADSVEYAEPDHLYFFDAVPDDTHWSYLWGMRKIEAPAAWDTTTGSASMRIGVIDTGVDIGHEDLAANIWTNPGEIADNGIDDDGNGYVDDVHGWDFYDDDDDPADGYGHGTHCAGTLGGVGNNATGVAGVNWTVSIVPIKVTNRRGSFAASSVLAEAIDYATDLGCVATNNSWGGGAFSTELRSAISRANDAGIIFAAAAGNDALDNDDYPHYPSSYDLPNIIAVAATDESDLPSVYS